MAVTGQGTPRRVLVVVGAALGSGRWLAEHVLSRAEWDHAYLIDSDRSRTGLRDLEWSFDCRLSFGQSIETADGLSLSFELDPGATSRSAQRSFPADSDDVTICIAVPPSALPQVVRALHAVVPAPTSVLVSVAGLATSLEVALQGGWPRDVVTGVHALNDAAAPTAFGQTIYLAPAGSKADPRVVSMVDAAGAVMKVGTAEEHDRTMSVVQALTHRHLIAFAEAVGASGLDIEDDLWLARTPLFEALLGLAVRVLEPRQQAMISVIQEALARPERTEALEDALHRIAPDAPSTADTGRWIQQVRSQFSGSFFESLRSVAAQTIGTAQRVRAELAEIRATGGLVGLARSAPNPRVHVGRIHELSSTSVEIEELLVGSKGRAALLVGPGVDNAARIGVTKRPARTLLSLGHVTVLSPAELDVVLDEWLARIPRDVRFLVPESISGAGVLQAVREMGGISDAVLVDEVVRTGQRSVVVRFGIRADRSIDSAIEQVRDHIGSVYRWPLGVSRRFLSGSARRIVYLGPAGTFSETAAAQLTSRLGADAEIEDVPGFEEVLDAVANGAIGVIPLSSSASGLVTRAVRALLANPAPIVAGGVIDVAVRFDAYTSVGAAVDELRGATVYSHPQALAQCLDYVRRMGLRPVETASTTAALEQVAASSSPAVALAGAGKAEAHGLRVLEREVDDLSGSITRFLVLGTPGTFGDLEGGSAPTLRSVWIGSRLSDALPLLSAAGAGVDELITDAHGNFALISSRDPGEATALETVRYLGSMPWSPRTPIVRARAEDRSGSSAARGSA
ncbi:prephenate dehydratase domain-containing protein [Microbacterium sp. NPDC019599]|uniref:prephenate dehydratase domain-containing protein n=1 Tax=Microbacterium sp. NPDC019599 TaxID=3154690 RepID=UPI0033CA28B4